MKDQNCNNTTKAESAIRLLRQGIENGSNVMILEAYGQVEHEYFSWDGLDVLFMEWTELVGEGNDILNIKTQQVQYFKKEVRQENDQLHTYLIEQPVTAPRPEGAEEIPEHRYKTLEADSRTPGGIQVLHHATHALIAKFNYEDWDNPLEQAVIYCSAADIVHTTILRQREDMLNYNLIDVATYEVLDAFDDGENPRDLSFF